MTRRNRNLWLFTFWCQIATGTIYLVLQPVPVSWVLAVLCGVHALWINEMILGD
jgi:hypothetical protein